MKKIIILFAALLISSTVVAQPPFNCGTLTALSVIHDRVDAAGFAPRLKEGSQSQFDCIAARDPYFYSQRFDAFWKSVNHWNGLLGQEIGVTFGMLPPPPAN